MREFPFPRKSEKCIHSAGDINILDFIDPLNEYAWKFSRDEYLDDNWDHIIFSVRSKGMPRSYPKGKDAVDIEPWVEMADGQFKGSLHGRAKF